VHKLVTPPAEEPISLEEAKLHCKVETDEDNSLIEALIIAAREYCEAFQWRAYITQGWELWLDGFPKSGQLILPRPPLISVDSITYYDVDDIGIPFDNSNYFVDTKNEPGWIVLNYGCSWPTEALRPANGVCVRFTVGYGDAEDVPQKVKQAILLIVGAWYEQRENFIATGGVPQEIPLGAKALLIQDRNF
jgi:uncharacterized phiE125 gp8 family phage protein